MIEAVDVDKRYGKTGRLVLHDVTLTVPEGSFYGIIGPNGSGKSTLLKLLSGVEKPDRGTVRMAGKDIGSYSRKELARRMAVLQQDGLPPVGFTVRETIEMGRYPYQSWLGTEAEPSDKLIDEVMERLGLTRYSEQEVSLLSGGERQRVALGKTMVQEPALLLLDEPTTFLDIGYQIQMMDYVRTWQKECGMTVIAVLHDLNLAAQYCDELTVLHEGKVAVTGTPSEVLAEEWIERIYGTKPIIVPHPESGLPQVLLRSGRISG
ncbi:ABC transporter ATP-binding protein [Paenibacillus swuensis]|uniref:ABC transporter ATP-binding protein n=1 Tax=Paenibacillus swuensis TaxID=1178515 RepID=A0A172THM7_9BACL|nr:ABC transporter ATP-binding protein [Paenibacillus swuensis]ANE46367.1 ABC transporter ATP-binding protein [Paenibacillus swuensis]